MNSNFLLSDVYAHTHTHIFKILLSGHLIKHDSKEIIFVRLLRKSFFLTVAPKEHSVCVYTAVTEFQRFHCLAQCS